MPAVVGLRGRGRDSPTATVVRSTARPATVESGGRRREALGAAAAALPDYAAARAARPTGTPVQLLANIGAVEDLAPAAAADAEGVGLFRTEFLFLDRHDAPTPAEQQAATSAVFEAFAGGARWCVRTLDAGADKPLAFLPARPRAQPGPRRARAADWPGAAGAAGRPAGRDRGGRRGATGAEVWVMAPMVSTVDEAAAFARRCARTACRPAGVMVEVPAAALRADRLMAAVDFASIGTNDLTQYAMATDRMAGELAELLDPWQPGVLDLIAAPARPAAGRASRSGCAARRRATRCWRLVLVGLGVTSLSMAARAVPQVGATLAGHTLVECEALARLALAADPAAAARDAVRERADGGRGPAESRGGGVSGRRGPGEQVSIAGQRSRTVSGSET